MSEEINKSGTFSDVEREAMRARAKELKAEARAAKNREEGEKDVLNAIEQMTEPDKSMGSKIHELVKKTAPALLPKTWYGMPAYANENGQVVCFFKAGGKYESRYATLGFNDPANIDDGNMWATSFALIKLTAAEENEIIELVKKAIS
ncbi:MAG: hypothetical protein ABI721_00520 [Candidatus Dojkabacteria bacterium]